VDQEALAAAEAEELDDLKGKRVHAWVVVLPGKRMLEQLIFIEPSTGKCVPSEACPYYGVESLWNSTNYWVNMQSKDIAAAKLDFDMSDTRNWEGLLYDSTASIGQGDGDDDDGLGTTGKADVEEEVNDKLVLADMPPSWVNRLHVPRDLFQNGCPNGYKRTTYRKGEIEHFAPYSREDGLVSKVTIYGDIERTTIAETRETFANRKDKLYRRTTAGKTTHEYFEPGRPRGLKEHILVDGEKRELHFYASARLDGLLSRVELVGKKTYMIFDGSNSPLVYRSVSFDGEAAAADIAPDKNIRKMAEKFRRSHELDAEDDVAKRRFEIAAAMIKVRYHYGADRVTCSSRTYAKDGSGHSIVQVNSFSRQPTDAQMLDDFTKLQAAERECINQIRDYDRQTKEILKKRDYEEQAIQEAEEEAARLSPGAKPTVPQHLTVSAYDTARSKLANEEDDDDANASAVPHDYLTPFLQEPIGVNEPPLTREDALQAREACLRSLKDRLVERANIVQSRLDDENQALSKRQAAFQRNRDHMDPSDEAEYERYCQEAMFRIQILEQRLDRHTELSLQKYAEMDARLRDDPRLLNLKLGATSR